MDSTGFGPTINFAGRSSLVVAKKLDRPSAEFFLCLHEL
jgi:hypothetical protein